MVHFVSSTTCLVCFLISTTCVVCFLISTTCVLCFLISTTCVVGFLISTTCVANCPRTRLFLLLMSRSIRNIETILCQYSDEYVGIILLEQRRRHRADVDAILKRTHFWHNMGPSWSMAGSRVRPRPLRSGGQPSVTA